MMLYKLKLFVRQWFFLKGRPIHIHPAYKFYRRMFYCRHNKHTTYPDAHFCIFCMTQVAPFPEWEITKFGYKPTVVSAINERHAVQRAIEQIYGSRVDDCLYHVFFAQQLKLKAFKDAVPVTVDEDMILCAKVEMQSSMNL